MKHANRTGLKLEQHRRKIIKTPSEEEEDLCYLGRIAKAQRRKEDLINKLICCKMVLIF